LQSLATDQIWHLMKEIKYCANLHDVSIVVNAIRHTRELADEAEDAPQAPAPYIPCDCALCAPEAGLDEDVEFIFPSPFSIEHFDPNSIYKAFFGGKQ
jgi:hypothetical protein